MRALLLLVAMILIASFPFVSDYLAEKRTGITYDKQRVYEIIDNYIEEHPGRIISSLQEHSINKQKEVQNDTLKNVMVEYASNVNNNNYPSFGEGKKVRVIEFFDYNCGYCKGMKDIIDEIIKNEDVHYIFREVPIFGEKSYLPSISALAINILNKDRYLQFNNALLDYKGAYTDEVIKDIVIGLGMDYAEFEKVKSGEEVKKLLQDTISLFSALKIGGTPAFIIGDEIVPGAIDLQTFRDKIHYAKERMDSST